MNFQKVRLNFFTVIISVVLLFFCYENVIAHGITAPSRNTNLQQPVETQQVIAQQNYDKVEIKTIPVKDNIYMLVGEGGNIGVAVGEDGALLIDSQFAPLTAKIAAAVNKINKQPIRFLMNTHYHFDHTDGNENMRALGATIIAHNNVPKQMSVAHSFKVLGMETPVSSKKALPIITFSDSTNLDVNGTKIHAFHIPLAHTDGDIIIHFQEKNVIHTGDIYFNGFYPFIDTEVGGSIDGMIAAINQILPLCNEETLIIPGHGNLSHVQELKTFRDMLEIFSNRVKKAISENMTLEDLIKTKPLADLDETWGKGFLNSDQFITLAYQSFVK